MDEQHRCMIHDCAGPVYAPAGTAYVCKEHFLDFLKWRRRKGPGMFHKYAGMSMSERDEIAQEWQKTVVVEK